MVIALTALLIPSSALAAVDLQQPPGLQQPSDVGQSIDPQLLADLDQRIQELETAIAAEGVQAAAVTCDKIASPTGNDATGTGSLTNPYRTAGRLVSSLAAGQVGCLRKPPGEVGLYEEDLTLGTAKSGISANQPTTLQTYPADAGKQRFATLKGRLRITGSYMKVAKLILDGRNANNFASPEIDGTGSQTGVTFADNNVTTRGRTVDCFHITTHPDQALLLRNRIHDCKRGVVVEQAVANTNLATNLIYDNDVGLRGGPNASCVLAYRNIFDGNVNNTSWGGTDTGTQCWNVVQYSTLSFPDGGWNVQTEDLPVTAGITGIFFDCLWRPDGSDGVQQHPKLFFDSSVVANPQYLDRGAKNFTITPASPCWDYTQSNRDNTAASHTDIYSEVVAGGGPATADLQPALPKVRAAFYYPWYPETWTVGGVDAKYTPLIGRYSYDSATRDALVDGHISALEYAKIDVAIASWWGRMETEHKEAIRIPHLLDRTERRQSLLRWALYYEDEGFSNPAATTISADLAYIKAKYADRPAYFRINGRPVIFVYGQNETCDMARRWKQANVSLNFYVVLKVFGATTWDTCQDQPDNWHQYAPSNPVQEHNPSGAAEGSYVISPGYDKAGETPVGRDFLRRDLYRWRSNVRNMTASGRDFHLITTFNEWGEGTAVESGKEWQSPSGRGTFLDALNANGQPNADPVIAAAGDISDSGGSQMATSDLMIGPSGFKPDLVLTLGDNQYECGGLSDYNNVYQPSWGRLRAYTNPSPGNHEYNPSGGNDCDATGNAGGYFDYFNNGGSATPDVLDGVAGQRGQAYYFHDVGSWRLIALNSEISTSAGSPQEQWLRNTALQNPPACILAYWHKPRFTAGNYRSNGTTGSFQTLTRPLWQALQDNGADVVLNGHDHNYARYKQQYLDGTATTSGIREFVVGTGGRSHYPLQSVGTGTENRETGTTWEDTVYGVLRLTLHPSGYDWAFVDENGVTRDPSPAPVTCH